MSWRIVSWVCAGVVLSGSLVGGAAQDIEALAEIRGLALPQEYHDRVARDPDVFEFGGASGRRPWTAQPRPCPGSFSCWSSLRSSRTRRILGFPWKTFVGSSSEDLRRQVR